MSNTQANSEISFLGSLVAIGLYISLNSILAIPLMDEDKTKTKEISVSLKEELTTIKTTFLTHVLDFKYDSLTLTRFDEINKALGKTNNSSSLQTNLGNKIMTQKLLLENHIDACYYSFLNEKLDGLNAKKRYKNKLLKEYKDFCSAGETEILNNMLTLRNNVLRLYVILVSDSTPYAKTKKEYADNLIPAFNFMLIKPVVSKPDGLSTPFLGFFWLANQVVDDESQTLAIIIGLIGLAIAGAVIGSYAKRSQTGQTNSLITGLSSTLIRGFSASVVSYLSVKAGLSIISTSTDTNANPYFILFICFIAAVYSEDIWLWVKSKLPAPNQTPTSPQQPVPAVIPAPGGTPPAQPPPPAQTSP